jgi:hypothetical protein
MEERTSDESNQIRGAMCVQENTTAEIEITKQEAE